MNDMHDGITREGLDSLLEWWKLAGVDLDYVTDATPWLDQDMAEDKPSAPVKAGDVAPVQSKSVPQKNAPEPVKLVEFPAPPASHAEFLEYWAQEPALALASGTGRRVAPRGAIKPHLMVIADMPDKDDLQSLFTGSSGELMQRILQAAGIAEDTVYFASLLPEHSLEMRQDPAILQSYRKLLDHHISLVEPRNVILLGNMPNSALTGNDLPKNRLSLQFINHDSGKIPAASSFHPRTLLQRSGLKAKAWQDWQWLKESMKA